MKFPERFFRKIFNNSLDDHELDVEFRCLHRLRDKSRATNIPSRRGNSGRIA